MEKRTEGAWIIHHTKKIQDVTQASDFEDIELAGKCGLFLSSLAASNEESTLSSEKVSAIAKASNIKKVELSSIKETLKAAQLIDTSANGEVSVLGITTSNILTHTSDIFNNTTKDNFQKAALELANYSSDIPLKGDILKEYISDTYNLGEKENSRLFKQAEDIRLIDYEEFDSEKIYFNGNLFKQDSIEKTAKVLSSLSSTDSARVRELDSLLNKNGCVALEQAQTILGSVLLSKLQSIAMYDFNEVSNNTHTKVFITKPSSFSKFGNPFEDDALDLAKAFISSLMYGMQVSSINRGRIQDYSMLINTVNKLLRGSSVGPCTAIGQDYQVLELNRVIQLEQYSNNMYYMRLLKFDIGQLALSVLKNGDVAEQATLETNLNSSSVSNYSGPEKNRIKLRRKKDTSNNSNVGELLRTMRK
ncbi:hypothetical protein [uncultured Bacteroides sp.]|uniref:hypothetical protein n=1 Tax=uncultured Bacteroides sp. TaxID=162156 RepID=UPI002AAC4C19|nr:hypothetical protein [uncultured Bacteroides sp.]